MSCAENTICYRVASLTVAQGRGGLLPGTVTESIGRHGISTAVYRSLKNGYSICFVIIQVAFTDDADVTIAQLHRGRV